MTSQSGKQTVTIHILPNMSINKGQSIEYNTRNIFLEKSYTKCGGKLYTDPSLKNQNWVYPWINSLKFHSLKFVFIVC